MVCGVRCGAGGGARGGADDMEEPTRLPARHDGKLHALLRLHVHRVPEPGRRVAGAVLLQLARRHPAAALRHRAHLLGHDGDEHLVLRLRQLQHHGAAPGRDHAVGGHVWVAAQDGRAHAGAGGVHGLRRGQAHAGRPHQQGVEPGARLLCGVHRPGHGHARGHCGRPALHGTGGTGAAGGGAGRGRHPLDLLLPLQDAHPAGRPQADRQAAAVPQLHQHAGHRSVDLHLLDRL
mmetsp:Transcript_12728/g.32642  ORF Transcript_12728/g.32642 Transcript_12728/m.32642 type:complete len:234 (-) Transcript_12728:529-1230(-)